MDAKKNVEETIANITNKLSFITNRAEVQH